MPWGESGIKNLRKTHLQQDIVGKMFWFAPDILSVVSENKKAPVKNVTRKSKLLLYKFIYLKYF